MLRDVFIHLLLLPWIVIGGNHGSDMRRSKVPEHIHHSCKDEHGDQHYQCNISQILFEVLDGYDMRVRPYSATNQPVVVKVGLWILSIDSINVMDMEYRIDLFLRQTWKDPRLRNSYPEKLTVSNTMKDRIWVPDTYFENSKRSEFHFVTVPNVMLRISQDGTVELNTRLSVVASCHMDLHMYPADKQTCYLNIHSYGYSTDDIRYEWEGTKSEVHVEKEAKFLPQYNVSKFVASMADPKMYVAGNWSGLSLSFQLERLSGHFYLHMYAICMMIVMLSWISFFIPRDIIVARVGLGMSSVLTVCMVYNTQESAMPKVAYIKLADWYLIASLLFVVSVLVEYTIVLYLIARQRRCEEKGKKDPWDDICSTELCLMTVDSQERMLKKRTRHNQNQKNQSIKPFETFTDEVTDNANDNDDELVFCNSTTYYLCFADIIDRYCRTLFPAAFFFFNAIYWIYYFTQGDIL